MASEHHGHGHVSHGNASHAGGAAINDVAEHQRTFDAFIRFWVYVFGFAALVLIFLAIFNS